MPKTCSKCHVERAWGSFSKRSAAPDGHQVWCKSCMSAERLSGSDLKAKRDVGKISAACELLVRSDLLSRGFEVTVPCSPTALHDLHAEIPSVGWVGVQVKAATCGRNSNVLRQSGKGSLTTSPILALVFLRTRRIEYRSGSSGLPTELLT